MKTKNNVQKAVLKSLAIITGLVFLSSSLDGQGLWKPIYNNSEVDHVSLAMAGNRPEVFTSMASSNSTSAFSAYLAAETDNELELEAWMTEASFFAGNALLEIETEEPLQLENWMLDASSFSMNTLLEVESEEEAVIEDWMVNEKSFEGQNKVIRTKTFVYSELKDSELNFENWMFDQKHWNIK